MTPKDLYEKLLQIEEKINASHRATIEALTERVKILEKVLREVKK